MDLFNATVKGDTAKVKKILSVYKTLVNEVDQNGCTALLYSVLKNFDEICEILIEAGADVNAVDTVGNTALMVASSKNHKSCVELLLNANAKVDIVNKTGKTAISYADESNNEEIIAMLIQRGANVYTIAADGVTPVWMKPKTLVLKKMVTEEQASWQLSNYKKEADTYARGKYLQEHPSVLGIFRRLAKVCTLRKFDDPLYVNTLELIRDVKLRETVEQILEASSDRKIWADDSHAAMRQRLKDQYNAAQIEIQSYVALHPRAYVQSGEKPDGELADMIKRRDEARRRFVSALKDELSEEHIVTVLARYEYLEKFGELFDSLQVPIKESEFDKLNGLPAVFPMLDSFVDKLDNWIRVNMVSPIENTNTGVKEYATTLQNILTVTTELVDRREPSHSVEDLAQSLFPVISSLEKMLDVEERFWTRDPVELYPDIRSDVQELCLTLSSYASTVRESIEKWRENCPSMHSERNTMVVWVGGAPDCMKYDMLFEEVKDTKKIVRRLLREYEDMVEDGLTQDEDSILKRDITVAQSKLQTLKRSLQAERAHLAIICKNHFPEMCLTQPKLKFQLDDMKEIESGLLLHDRYLTDYSDRVLLSCSSRSMLYSATFCARPIVLRKYLVTQGNAAAREIKKEARELAKLSHSPYVIPVESIFMDEDLTVCLQLPFYEFGNMNKFLKNYGSGLTSSGICAIMRRVCKGLAYLHSKDVVHCDLKLENILIDNNCSPVISDIDISVPNHDKRVSAALVWTRGHVEYMAPENLPPVSVPMALPSDIYAFGICLMKALGKTCVRDAETGVHVVPQSSADDDEGLEELLSQIMNLEPMLRLNAHQIVDHEFFPYKDSDELVFQNIRTAVEEINCADSSTKIAASEEESAPTIPQDAIPLVGLANLHNKQGKENINCCVCHSLKCVNDGILCAGGHFTCEECLGKHVEAEVVKGVSERRWMEIRNKFDGNKSIVRRTAAAIKALYPEINIDHDLDKNPWTELKMCEKWFSVTDFFTDRQCIVCPCHSLCKSAPFADTDVIRHISAEQCVSFKLAKDELIEWRHTCKSLDAIGSERDRIVGMSDVEEAATEARDHIITRIMPLNCPRCGVEFACFEGCLATVCATCACGFCSLCGNDCGTDATSHVLHCEYNTTGCLFASDDDFKDFQVARQNRMTEEYLSTLNDELREILGHA